MTNSLTTTKLIREAILSEWGTIHKEFFGNLILHIARQRLKVIDANPRDDTILREFRRLRQEGLIDYKCIDHKRSLYKKRELKEYERVKEMDYVNSWR